MAKKTINIRAGFDLKAFSTSSQNLARQLRSSGKKMQSIGRSMSMSLTAPIVALGGLAVKTFADFQQSMAKVQAISGATGDELKNLTDLAKQLV
jgi:phage-related minor tail protein